MHISLDTLLLYMSNHSRWFEDPTRRPAGIEHLALYHSMIPADWTLWRRGLWLVAAPPGDDVVGQGWKLHVSAASRDSVAVLGRALPILRDARVHFKFLLDPDTVRDCNGREFPRAASGKFITVYPAGEREFRRVAAELADALAGFQGPYVLSDRRVPGSKAVHYRYGGFAGVTRRGPDGVNSLLIRRPDGAWIPDVRTPYWSPPEWVTDPFPEEPADSATSLAGGRFTVTSAIAFSNRGGVYQGIDNETGADVILREARPRVEVGAGAADAVEVLQHEFEMLGELADAGSFVRPIAFFREWEHAFVAEEYIEGTHFGHFSIANNPLYDLDLTPDRLRSYYERLRGLWRQIAEAIDAAHQRGIVLADLSPTNIMVTDDDTVHMIDLEAAFREGSDESLGLVTPGMANRRTLESGDGDRRNDYFALGAIMLCSIMAIQQAGVVDEAIPRRVLSELAVDLDLPPELVSLVEELYDPESSDVPDPGVLRKRLDDLPFAAAWTRPIPLALPARSDAGERVALQGRIESTLRGVTDYFDNVADLGRTDRLFPADLMVFETNPLSVAYGAYGVLYAQHLLRGEVSPGALAWALQQSTSARAMPPGLYYGQAGVAWVLSAIGRPEAAAQVLRRSRDHELRWSESGVLSGSAGHGMACLRLWRDTGSAEFLDDARAAGEWLAGAARRDERGAWWPDAGGQAPIGYGFGGSGVAMFLLALHAATGDRAHLALGRDAVEADLSCAEWTPAGVPSFGSVAPTAAAPTQVRRQYWDRGTAGVLTTVLRYHAVTGDPVLRAWIDDLLRDARRKYVVFPQLFHGLSGIGNVLLDAFEFLGDEALLEEARRTAAGVLCFAVRRPEGVTFPGEQTVRESADFATGSAGVALFLHRLLHARPGGRTNFNFVLDDLLGECGR